MNNMDMMIVFLTSKVQNNIFHVKIDGNVSTKKAAIVKNELFKNHFSFDVIMLSMAATRN